jgi:hypothetical protein
VEGLGEGSVIVAPIGPVCVIVQPVVGKLLKVIVQVAVAQVG